MVEQLKINITYNLADSPQNTNEHIKIDLIW